MAIWTNFCYQSSIMEVLSDILRGLRTSGTVYFCDFLVPPWEHVHEDESRAMFHVIRRGRCQIVIEGEPVDLEPGDFAFLAPGVDHRLRSADADAPRTLMLCGYCQFDAIENDAVLRALPRHVLLHQQELDQWPWLSRTLEHLSAEYMSDEPGNELTVNKLTEVLLVQLLRADFGRSGKEGIVAALQDKRLARALTAIHADSGKDWTIGTAAEQASMSRSGFARKFRELLDASFFDYLSRLRMRNARDLLRNSNMPIADIAERVGYQSDISFVKAFKKLHGVTPRRYRQSQA